MDDRLQNHFNAINLKDAIPEIFIAAPFCALLLASVLLIIVACVQKQRFRVESNEDSSNPESENKESDAIQYSIIAIWAFIPAYAISLDMCALYYKDNLRDEELKYVYHKDSVGDGQDILFHIPIVVTAFDLVIPLPSYLVPLILI